jgi:hypothetical protein
MRAVWISFWTIAALMPLSFALCSQLGLTEHLHCISTTMWAPGHPSALELAGAAASLISWIGAKAFLPIFLLTGLPFFLCDLRNFRRRKPAQ